MFCLPRLNNFQLLILLPPPSQFYVMLKILPKTSSMLGKYLPTEIGHQPLNKMMFCFLIINLFCLRGKELASPWYFHGYATFCLFSRISLLHHPHPPPLSSHFCLSFFSSTLLPFLAFSILPSRALFCFLLIYYIILPGLCLPSELFLTSHSTLSTFVSCMCMPI